MAVTHYKRRLAGQFCDAILQVEDVHFPVHRIIICDCSPYFQALFLHQMTSDKIVPLTLVSPDIMQIIVDFAYTDSVAVTKDNVHELIVAADMLNIMGIIQACSNFIGEQLSPQNCIGIWRFTDICPVSELRCKAFHYIMEHFERVVNCEEYLELSVQELTEILGKDELNVKNERTVFNVILSWIAHMPEEREQHMAMLLSQVRLGKTSIEFIENNVMTNQLVKLNPECQEIVNHCIKIIQSFGKNTQKSYNSCLRDTPARPRLPNSIIMVSGGKKCSDASCKIEVYDHLVDRWIICTDRLNEPRANHGSVFLDGYVYFVGGTNLMENLNSMARLDLRTHIWQEMMYMNYRRGYVCVTKLNGFIYAFGGIDDYVCLNTAERYCPKNNQWTLIAPMINGRRNASCAALDGKIYICGGLIKNVGTRTAECYDPETNQWTMVCHMNITRNLHRVVAYDNQIYAPGWVQGLSASGLEEQMILHVSIPTDRVAVAMTGVWGATGQDQLILFRFEEVGGIRGIHPLQSIETYQPKYNTWTMLCSMLIPRRHFCLEVMEGQFYIIGGSNVRRQTYSAEVFNPQMDELCSISDTTMFYEGMSSCVVSGIHNMVDFAFPRDSLPLFETSENV